MCIEAYAKQPIRIPFEHESIEFVTESSYLGRYTILVENCGDEPIDEIFLLYPRPLMSVGVDGIPSLNNFVDLAPQVIAEAKSGRDRSKRISGSEYQWKIPHPERPQDDLWLKGRLDPANARYSVPAALNSAHITRMSLLGVSAWSVKLKDPIPPHRPESKLWLSMGLQVMDAGRLIPESVLGPLVHHQFASPLSVRTTIEEMFRSGAETAFDDDQGSAPSDRIEEFKSLLEAFHLHLPREVSIEYYQLSVRPGNPIERELTNLAYEGQLWMRSDSPMAKRRKGQAGGSWIEPVYQWKSGEILRRLRGAPMDFTVRFALRLPKK